MPAPHDTDDTGRPRWSVSEAAKRAGVARSTVQRHLARGAIPGAYRTEDGVWSIGVDDLLAAGFRVDAPAPPDELQREHARTTTGTAPEPADVDVMRRRIAELEALTTRAAELEATLADTRRRADVAEAIARERAEQITDLRRTVAALEAGRSDRAPSAPPAPASTPLPARTTRDRGVIGRFADRFGL